MSKNKILLVVIIVLTIIGIFWITKLKNKNIEENIITEPITKIQNVVIDEESGTYVLYDENGEEVGRAHSEGEVKAYRDNPDYRPENVDFNIDNEEY